MINEIVTNGVFPYKTKICNFSVIAFFECFGIIESGNNTAEKIENYEKGEKVYTDENGI